ncbi:MAG: hypothetical protein ABFD83_11330 [Armatimonadota bacterium]
MGEDADVTLEEKSAKNNNEIKSDTGSGSNISHAVFGIVWWLVCITAIHPPQCAFTSLIVNAIDTVGGKAVVIGALLLLLILVNRVVTAVYVVFFPLIVVVSIVWWLIKRHVKVTIFFGKNIGRFSRGVFHSFRRTRDRIIAASLFIVAVVWAGNAHDCAQLRICVVLICIGFAYLISSFADWCGNPYAFPQMLIEMACKFIRSILTQASNEQSKKKSEQEVHALSLKTLYGWVQWLQSTVGRLGLLPFQGFYFAFTFMLCFTLLCVGFASIYYALWRLNNSAFFINGTG